MMTLSNFDCRCRRLTQLPWCMRVMKSETLSSLRLTMRKSSTKRSKICIVLVSMTRSFSSLHCQTSLPHPHQFAAQTISKSLGRHKTSLIKGSVRLPFFSYGFAKRSPYLHNSVDMIDPCGIPMLCLYVLWPICYCWLSSRQK
jgi:hypothetical protein